MTSSDNALAPLHTGLRRVPVAGGMLMALAGATLLALTAAASAGPRDPGGPFEVDDQIISDPSSDLPAPEFDPVGNRMIWQDRFGNLWVAGIDTATGDIAPLDGRGVRVDTGLASVVEVGNTPRFTYGQEDVLVYTRKVEDTLWLAAARNLAPGVWTTELLQNGDNRYRIEGTPVEFEGTARMAYNRITETGEVVVSYRDWNDPASEGTADVTGVGGRFLGAEPFLLTLRKDANGVNQVFLVDLATGIGQPITDGPANKLNPFVWYAPEFDSYAFVVLLDFVQLAVYRQVEGGGWERFSRFPLPSDKPFISSPEAFAHNGRSYVSAVAAQELGDGTFPGQPVGPSEVWVTGIDPDLPFARRIDDPTTEERRSEPEAFMLDRGVPVVYYTERPEGPGADLSVLRRASTGLGPELGYETPVANGGDWSGIHRDNRNTGSVPFPLADTFTAAAPVELPALQFLRSTLGVGGQLFSTVSNPNLGVQALVAYDTFAGSELFRLDESVLGTRLSGVGGLTDRDGNLYLVSNELASKVSPGGQVLWSTPVPGLAVAPQFLSDGRVLLFTWNGWVYVLDPANGAVVFSADLTPGRTYAPAPSCVTANDPAGCAYAHPPAVDHRNDVVYVSFTRVTGSGLLQAFNYDPVTGALANRWGTQAPRFALPTSAPVLNADGTRVYLQERGGDLVAVSTILRRERWRAAVGANTGSAPLLRDGLLLLPGISSEGAGGITVIEDTGGAPAVRFQTADYLPRSVGAAGADGRFVLAVEDAVTGEPGLGVIDVQAGTISVSPWAPGVTPNSLRSLVVRQDGTVLVQGWGVTTLFSFSPD